MGQMTDAQVGLSVSLPLKFDNINLIICLLDLSELYIYVSGLCENDDEILEYDDVDNIDELLSMTNIDDFKNKYKELDLNENIIIHFMYVYTKIYARNLSYRSTPHLFSNDIKLSSPQELINNIQKGIEIFKKANVPDEYIKIGNTIYQG